MARKKKNRESGDIDVSAFADIAFLLIIFFILTSTFVQTAGALVDIPAGKPPEDKAEEEDKVDTINVAKNAIHYGEDEDAPKLTLPELRDKLFALDLKSKEKKDRILIVECADDVPYERYFRVLTAVSEAGGIVAIIENEEDEKK